MNEKKLVLNIGDVCELLGVSRPLVNTWIKRKQNPMPCIKTGHRYCIPRASMERWIEEEAARNSGMAR